MRTPRTYRLWGVWAAAVVLVTTGTAHAFYWAGWPGSGLKADTTLILPGVNHPKAPTPEANPGPLPENPTIPTPGPVGPSPAHAPEPATGAAGLIGLAVLAVRRRLRRAGRTPGV